jgi:hypothetical protein
MDVAQHNMIVNTRYFYKPAPMRTLHDIVVDTRALEAETDGLLEEIISDVFQEKSVDRIMAFL